MSFEVHIFEILIKQLTRQVSTSFRILEIHWYGDKMRELLSKTEHTQQDSEKIQKHNEEVSKLTCTPHNFRAAKQTSFSAPTRYQA
jgi:hypothetical protein